MFFNKKDKKVYNKEELLIRDNKLFDKRQTFYTAAHFLSNIFLILLLFFILIVVVLIALDSLHYLTAKQLSPILILFAVSVTFLEFLIVIFYFMSEFYYRYLRHMSDKYAIYIYLTRLTEVRGNRDIMPNSKRESLINNPIKYAFLDHCLNELFIRRPDFTLEEKFAIKEFSKNIRKFNEITKLADKKTFETISPYFRMLADDIMQFYKLSSKFMIDYYSLKIAYNNRSAYLKQFSITNLYNINKRGERLRWFFEKFLFPLLITFGTVFGILSISLILYLLHIIPSIPSITI